MDDAAAARACGHGNVNAFRHFVDRYQGRALDYARVLRAAAQPLLSFMHLAGLEKADFAVVLGVP